MSIFDNYSKIEIEEVIQKYNTWRDVLTELGAYDKHNKMVPTLKRKLEELNIDYSNIDLTPIRKKAGHCRNKYTKFLDEEVFRKNNGLGVYTVRRRFKECSEKYVCAICEMLPIWQGKDLVLTMDHIDGDTDNNELNNLRWVCPNCDRQLSTYAGKNKKRVYNLPLVQLEDKKCGKNLCSICNTEKDAKSNLCFKCSKIEMRKVDRPSRETLKEEIRKTSFTSLGKKYGVTDNAIRKWCFYYNLPCKVNEIYKISDEDWEYI